MHKAIAFLLIAASFTLAEGGYHITRTHYVAIGLDASFAEGDLDGKGFSSIDDDDANERVYTPYLGTFLIPNIELGANLNQHTIALAFGLWNPSINYGKDTEYYTKNEANYWRISAGYRYNLFWPEEFQIGIGIAYSFSRLQVDKSAFEEDKTGDVTRGTTIHSGNGFAVSTTIHYLFADHLGMEAVMRYRLVSFSSVTTPENGYCSLDKSLWEHFLELGVRTFVQF